MRVLVIDNYDSFVFNLVQYLGQLGAECDVRRNDEITVAEVGATGAAGVLLSPGPGSPDRAGICLDVIREYAGKLPIFGVCLGHQAIGEAFGATVDPGAGAAARQDLRGPAPLGRGAGRAAGPVHRHPLPLAGRGRGDLPAELEVTGWTESGVVMAMRHRTLPIEGVQFHPESVLTQGGHLMLANWLAACGFTEALDRAPALAAEVETRRRAAFAPDHPVRRASGPARPPAALIRLSRDDCGAGRVHPGRRRVQGCAQSAGRSPPLRHRRRRIRRRRRGRGSAVGDRLHRLRRRQGDGDLVVDRLPARGAGRILRRHPRHLGRIDLALPSGPRHS